MADCLPFLLLYMRMYTYAYAYVTSAQLPCLRVSLFMRGTVWYPPGVGHT